MKEQILNNIKDYRKRDNLTQEELAQEVGVSRQSIISIEKGHYIPSLTLALRFTRLFSCTTDQLFKLNEEE
jgi:putative transcriptional regulator